MRTRGWSQSCQPKVRVGKREGRRRVPCGLQRCRRHRGSARLEGRPGLERQSVRDRKAELAPGSQGTGVEANGAARASGAGGDCRGSVERHCAQRAPDVRDSAQCAERDVPGWRFPGLSVRSTTGGARKVRNSGLRDASLWRMPQRLRNDKQRHIGGGSGSSSSSSMSCCRGGSLT